MQNKKLEVLEHSTTNSFNSCRIWIPSLRMLLGSCQSETILEQYVCKISFWWLPWTAASKPSRQANNSLTNWPVTHLCVTFRAERPRRQGRWDGLSDFSHLGHSLISQTPPPPPEFGLLVGRSHAAPFGARHDHSISSFTRFRGCCARGLPGSTHPCHHCKAGAFKLFNKMLNPYLQSGKCLLIATSGELVYQARPWTRAYSRKGAAECGEPGDPRYSKHAEHIWPVTPRFTSHRMLFQFVANPQKWRYFSHKTPPSSKNTVITQHLVFSFINCFFCQKTSSVYSPTALPISHHPFLPVHVTHYEL